VSLRIDFGLVTLQQATQPGPSFDQLYDDALRHAEQAERAGFDGFWVSEHHLSPDGYLPSPLVVLSAVAARTRSIELGTNIAIAPLYHPRRLAEDAAVIAAIAHRRVILGLGAGYRAAEFAAFGQGPSGRAAHIDACARFCTEAWSAAITDPVHGGIPAPAVRPEVWIGGLAPAALDRAGRLSCGYIATSGTVEVLRERLRVVDQAAASAGRAVRPGVVTNHLVSLSRDGRMRPSVARGIDHMMAVYRGYAAQPSDAVIGAHLQATDPRALSVWGDPEKVAAGLAEYVRAFAGDREHHLMVRLHYPGMSAAEAEEHIQLFAESVAPRLRSIAENSEPMGASRGPRV
jgi:alkanesulfonate monooxygenase SsuD/methylene tetrahydromethanopterin reductase-like flavin-dependent oxidoreductase (luciferase family)